MDLCLSTNIFTDFWVTYLPEFVKKNKHSERGTYQILTVHVEIPLCLNYYTINQPRLDPPTSKLFRKIDKGPFTNYVRDHSSITSAKRWVGGVRKWQFLMIYSTVNHQRGEWVGLKKSKTWWRNTWMVPYPKFVQFLS